MPKKFFTIAAVLLLGACGTVEMDSRSDASAPISTSAFDMPPKNDRCCLKFSPNGICLQKTTPNCIEKENLNIEPPLEKEEQTENQELVK